MLEQDSKNEKCIALSQLKFQLIGRLELIDKLIGHLIKNRLNISDQALISCLKALAWASRNAPEVCHHILSNDRALDELFDFLKYPHKGIKI